MKRLMGYVKKNLLLMIIGPVFKFLEATTELLNPIMVAKMVDYGVQNKDYSFITKYGIIIVLINIFGLIFSVFGQKCSAVASTRISRAIRNDAFSHISSFSHSELDRYGTASLVNRLTDDINQIEGAVGVFIRTIMRVPFLLVGAFVLSLIINIKMSLVFLGLIPIVVIILWVYMKKTSPYFTLVRNKLDKLSNVTRENLSGTRVIRAFNKQKDEEKRFNLVSEDYTNTNIHVGKISAMIEPIILLIVDVAVIAILALGGWQINIGKMSQGDVIALSDYVSIITISLLMLADIIAIFVRTNASIKRVNEIFLTHSSIIEENEDAGECLINENEIMQFENVCFNYTGNKNEKYFIENLNFAIKKNQTIGIIGGTGSGKTTIASLMTRFYDATDGKILFKGKDIKKYKFSELRRLISIVQQRSVLFSGSLRKNMQIRKADASDEEIIEALKISQAWGFVSNWSNPLDYQIMAGGKNVSGGQMQRLTIARALVGNPELLILDDSSSALDFLTDSNLRKELKKLNTTLVIISQRATSIQQSDLIIVMDHGEVAGMGKHNDLIKNCEIYKEIYNSQTK